MLFWLMLYLATVVAPTDASLLIYLMPRRLLLQHPTVAQVQPLSRSRRSSEDNGEALQALLESHPFYLDQLLQFYQGERDFPELSEERLRSQRHSFAIRAAWESLRRSRSRVLEALLRKDPEEVDKLLRIFTPSPVKEEAMPEGSTEDNSAIQDESMEGRLQHPWRVLANLIRIAANKRLAEKRRDSVVNLLEAVG